MELNELLNRTAGHIVADGTRTESLTLQAMASAAGNLNPGAAAALVDWDGSEIARLRAFGIVHGVLLRELPYHAQAQLLTYLLGPSSPLELAGKPALSQAPQKRVLHHAVHAPHWSRLMPVKKVWHRANGPSGAGMR